MKTIIYLTLLVTVCTASQFRFKNHCLWPVWPRFEGDQGKGNPGNGSFELAVGVWVDVDVPMGWSGRLWGRTGCTDHLKDKCQTGTIDTTPATVAHFNLSGVRGELDYYSLSLVDGFNLPMNIGPIAMTHMKVNGSRCDWAGCYSNINDYCPKELEVMHGDQIVACVSGCTKYKSDDYCCRDTFVTKDHKCDASKWPKNYLAFFHKYCDSVYGIDPQYDEAKALYSCGGNPQTGFEIMFCPGPNYSS